MRLRIWLGERRCAAVAAHRARRAFRRHHLTPEARARLHDAMKRRTP